MIPEFSVKIGVTKGIDINNTQNQKAKFFDFGYCI